MFPTIIIRARPISSKPNSVPLFTVYSLLFALIVSSPSKTVMDSSVPSLCELASRDSPSSTLQNKLQSVYRP